MKKTWYKLNPAVMAAILGISALAVPARADGITPIVPVDDLSTAVTTAQTVAVTIIGVFLGVLVFRWAVKLIKKAVSAAG